MEGFDSHVKDMSLAEWGRKEIELAQVEMPGMLFSILSLTFF
jgi:S-adenosylhomocysteine hydrolase